MRRARWLAPWKDSRVKPSIYHCISRVVDRRFVFGDLERERFRTFLRMQERFSGCRVLSYCVMSNHFHILLEVVPMPEGGLTDEELLWRLGATSTEAEVAQVAVWLKEARAAGDMGKVERLHQRYTYRMHNLSEFMKALLIRFTRWFNRVHRRSGTLWEERFKSVIVEDGVAARAMSAYIDLNPVRAGLVKDPARYRWSSYGEAVGGGAKGNGRTAREGLVRAYLGHEGVGFEAGRWGEVSRSYRRLMGMALGSGRGAGGMETSVLECDAAEKDAAFAKGAGSGSGAAARARAAGAEGKKGAGAGGSAHVLPELSVAGILRFRVRYFTDGAVIGSRRFVDEVFAGSRDRFPPGRKDGARRMRGTGSSAAGILWTIRDLRLRI